MSFQKEIKWESTERKLKPWGSLGVLLIVEVVKTMEFYQQLLLSDRVGIYGAYVVHIFRVNQCVAHHEDTA